MLYPSAELYNLTNILPLKGFYHHKKCLFSKAVICDRNYSTINFNFISHDTRSQSVFNYNVTRNNLRKSKISFAGLKLLNNVPTEFVNLSYELFNSKLRSWLLEKDQITKLSKLYSLQR